MMLRSSSVRGLLYYGGSLIVGVPLAIGMARVGATSGPIVAAALATAFMAAAHFAFLWYWRRLDEAARAAQKDAMTWGGLAWLCAMMVGWVTLGLHALPMPPTPWGRTDPAAYVAMGLGASMIGFTACFLLAWGVWWMRRR